jgi:hypothetical protein
MALYRNQMEFLGEYLLATGNALGLGGSLGWYQILFWKKMKQTALFFSVIIALFAASSPGERVPKSCSVPLRVSPEVQTAGFCFLVWK